MSLNTHYNVVFRNERDDSQFRALAYQMHPNDAKWLLDALEDATKETFGYLFLNHHPTSSRYIRVMTNILPNKKLTVYIKRPI